MYRIRTTPFIDAPKGGAQIDDASIPSEPTLAPEMPLTRAAAWARAAWTSENIGLHERAMQLYGRALKELASIESAPDWRLTAAIRNNLASILRFSGHIAEAESEYVLAINLLEAQSAPEASSYREKMILNLADLYHESGYEAQARSLANQAAAVAA